MAKVWNLGETFESLVKQDKSDLADFGGRFPIATGLMATVAATANKNAMQAIFNALGDNFTMRKLESALKGKSSAVEVEEVEEEEVTEEKSAKKAPAKKEKKAPVKKAAPEPEEDEDEEDDEKEESATDYASMSAVELYKLCRNRKIKITPKKPAAVYIKALEAEDAKNTKYDDEDDWDDEENEKSKKKAATKKVKAVEDDEDDWEI